MAPREQRLIRKKWKENSKNYRLKKNQIEMEISMLEANTPPVSSDEENHPPTANLSFQRQIGRKIANKNKVKRYRQRKEAARKIQDLTRKVESYKKKYYRLLRKTKPKRNPDLTPVTKINLLGPAAIWAHLRPILTNYTQNGINTIHFLSDSPATQYRNKEMFCFNTNHFKKHFPEISATDIEKFTSIISKQSSLAFKGTLKVHQVLPVKNKLYLRSLSCFTCRDFCNHFDLGSLAYENSFTSSESNEASEEELPLSIFLQNKSKAPSQKLMFSDVYSDDEVPTCSYSSSIRAKTGNYVLVSIKSVNKKLAVEYRCVAVCQSDFQEGEIKVAFLKLSDCLKWAKKMMSLLYKKNRFSKFFLNQT
nr:unnamed protein product [Callosobruchus analis]